MNVLHLQQQAGMVVLSGSSRQVCSAYNNVWGGNAAPGRREVWGSVPLFSKNVPSLLVGEKAGGRHGNGITPPKPSQNALHPPLSKHR